MKLAEIFTSNIVFAARKPIRVFGSGKGEVAITFNNQTKNVKSEKENWLIEFPPMDYGGPYEMKAVLNGEVITLKDIYVGEVYMVAGQSNIQFKMKESSSAESVYASNDKCRLFTTDRIEDTEYFKLKDGWIKCEKETVKEWSCIGYFVGNGISSKKNIAVGIIACYQGASIIESWLPKGTLEKLGINIPVKEKHFDHYFENYQAWNKDGKLYEYQFKKIAPYSVSGVIWYQGESDAFGKEAKLYDVELKELINVWRRDLLDENLPFVVVQIADYNERRDEAWKDIQDAQLKIQEEVKGVKTVISKDVCESNCIHPSNKEKLSRRIIGALIK